MTRRRPGNEWLCKAENILGMSAAITNIGSNGSHLEMFSLAETKLQSLEFCSFLCFS